MPKVSVIVPIYGVEAYIGQCARSLMAQSYSDVEFIFVNDGTPDRSMEVLSENLDLSRQVKIINKENAGLPQARLTGILAAEGEYILHLDSDDWIEPLAVEKLVAAAEESGADLIYYDFWKEYGNRSKLDHERLYTVKNKDLWMRRLYHDAAYGYVWSKFARRELYDGIFAPKYNMHEDIVFSTQLIFRAGSIAQLSVPLVHYRRTNTGSATRVKRSKRRVQSARNMLDFYANGGPEIEIVGKDILWKAWWRAIRYDRSLFREYPFLKLPVF